jgi:hypothetical protein
MINMDGVLGGNYRTSFVGQDLNRQYIQQSSKDYVPINPRLVPEISAVKKLVKDHAS